MPLVAMYDMHRYLVVMDVKKKGKNIKSNEIVNVYAYFIVKKKKVIILAISLLSLYWKKKVEWNKRSKSSNEIVTCSHCDVTI